MDKLALMVPIHLDFCFVSENDRKNYKHKQAYAHADFSKLPYQQGEERHNTNTPFLTEAILREPFSDNQPGQEPHSLAAGLHIHWAVPEALTHGKHSSDSGEVVYPALPNRWLIRIKIDGKQHLRIVESDYVSTQKPDGEHQSITYPVSNSDIAYFGGRNPTASEFEQPFRYVGRVEVIHQDGDDHWPYNEIAADRLKRLTAVGYGDPSFASYYPHCHSVFGYHYPVEISKSDLNDGSMVQITGWYSDLKQDPIHELMAQSPPLPLASALDQIQQQFGWASGEDKREGHDSSSLPEGELHQMICFAEVRIHKDDSLSNLERLKPHRISLGHSGTEALGALLHAMEAEGHHDTEVETQLAYSLLNHRWQGSELDVWDRLQAERHRQGFTALPGETHWGLKDITADGIQVPSWIQLPEQLVSTLYDINEQWIAYQQAAQNRQYLQHQLFAEWGKYLITKYDTDQAHHDPNVISTKLRALMTEIGDGTPSMDEQPLATLTALLQAYSQGQLLDAPANMGIPTNQVALQAYATDNTALPTGLRIRGTDEAMVAESGLPLSTQAFRLPPGGYWEANASQGVQALSCWIKVDSTPEPSFFPIQLTQEALEDRFWDRLEVNGQPWEDTLPLATQNFPTEQWAHLYLEFTEPLPPGTPIMILGTAVGEARPGAIAGLRLYTRPLTEIQKHWDHNMLGQSQFELHQTPGPHYYRPTDPTVLIEGAGMQSSTRRGDHHWYNDQGDLFCFLGKGIWDAGDHLMLHKCNTEQHNIIDQQQKLADDNHYVPIGKRIWKTQPWHPTWLEWEVSYYPYQTGHSQNSASRLFAEDFFLRNGSLATDHPDWEPRADQTIGEPTTYRGRSLLSASAKHSLLKRLYEELNQVLAQHGQAPQEAIPAYQPHFSEAKVLQNLTDFEVSLKARLAQEDASIIQYYEALIDSGKTLAQTHVMAQSLGTLHPAMIMHRGGLHAPVADPLGDPAFAAEVQTYLEGYLHRQAAITDGDFHPLRHGFLRIQALRILDNFGKIKTFEFQAQGQDTLIRAQSLTPSAVPAGLDAQRDLWLPPRVVQASRLHFRWLDAQHPTRELMTYPDSHPVMGWLMHDPLGGYLAVYDGEGTPLGSLSPVGAWLPFPGWEEPVGMGDLAPELRAVIAPLLDNTAANELYDLIEEAVDFLDPEDAAYADGWERLLGHPLALVRARVDLHLQHSPVADHHWQASQADISVRETDNFEQIHVPLRLGAPNRVNDGLIGYWVNQGDDELTTCHTPFADQQGTYVQSEDVQNPAVVLKADPNAPAQTLTLLMDPHSAIHLTTGVLPVKSISIPQKAFADAIRRISTAFFRTRVLSPDRQVSLPYAPNDGQEWTWYQQQRHTWTEASEQGVVSFPALRLAFPKVEATDLWQALIAQNWIHPVSAYRAILMPTDARQGQQLPGFEAIVDRVHQYLLRFQLQTPITQTSFPDDLVIKEGWLRLSPEQDI